MKNNLATVLATPIPLCVEYSGVTITLHFNRVGIGHRELFKRKFGERGIEQALETLDLDVISKILFMLLPREEKEKLDDPQLVKRFVDYDEDDEEINLAPKRIDRLRFILGSFSETTLELVLEVFGTSLKQIEKYQSELDEMPEDKKKETLAALRRMTGQE